MCVVDGQVKRQRSKAGQKISSYETSSMPRVASSGPTNQPGGQIQALTYKYRTQIQTWFSSETWRMTSYKIFYFLLRTSPPEKNIQNLHLFKKKCKQQSNLGSGVHPPDLRNAKNNKELDPVGSTVRCEMMKL